VLNQPLKQADSFHSLLLLDSTEIPAVDENNLSYRARKALMVHIGEEAGTEIADLISRLVTEVEELRRTKVSVTKIVPTDKS